MLALKLVALLVLILFTADYSLAEDVSICVKSDEAAVCQTTDANHTIHHLSELPTLLKSNSETLYIYLSTGFHPLTTCLNFSTKTVIEGDSTEESIIQCTNLTGIKFAANDQNISIENLLFRNCGRSISLKKNHFHAALFFKNADYTLKMLP